MPRAVVVLAITGVLLVAACGPAASVAPESVASSADLATASSGEVRTVAVDMSDTFRFDPERIEIAAGESIRFEVTNSGSIVHEFYVGDETAQAEHEAEMQTNGMAHDDPNGVSVDPGATKAFEMTFSDAGELVIGCHEAGHYEAGMRGVVVVQ
jgi:uncharacterized cupredoxin-like copper-binding protein